MPADWSAIRREFPSLAGWTYLNTATYGHTPRRAVEAIGRHMARRDETACSDFLSWFDDADLLRADLGRLIHCRADDIAFLPTASAALSLLLGGLDWRAGDRVITLEHEFPNNQYYPALLRERGVEFVETTWDRFYDEVRAGARLVAISSVNYTTGFRAPLEEIARELDRRGVLFYVDGTQSVGALRMDVSAFRPAMMAVDAYKWMLTPNGAGFVYVDPQTRSWLKPNVIGWRSHHEWRRVESLHRGAPEFSQAAEKYEGGMLPFPALYALHEVTKLMLETGVDAIEARVLELAARVRSKLGVETPRHPSPVVSVRIPGMEASEAARRLKQQRVLVSARHGNLRVSTHFYNNEADVDRLESVLRSMEAIP